MKPSLIFLCFFLLCGLTFTISQQQKQEFVFKKIPRKTPATLYRLNKSTGTAHYFDKQIGGWVEISETGYITTTKEPKAVKKLDLIDDINILNSKNSD